jgi:hypothetical protein
MITHTPIKMDVGRGRGPNPFISFAHRCQAILIFLNHISVNSNYSKLGGQNNSFNVDVRFDLFMKTREQKNSVKGHNEKTCMLGCHINKAKDGKNFGYAVA